MVAHRKDQPAEIPSHDELVARARALAPAIAARATRAEMQRRVPAESVEEFVEAGLLPVLIPRRWGGYGLGMRTWFEVATEIGAACASTGWLVSLLIHYGFVVATFPEQAQQEIWKEGPDVLLAASLTPSGVAEAIEGGYRVSGEFPYASGADHASWVIVCCPVDTGTSKPDPRLLLLRPGEYSVRDTWFSIGLRATGSNTLVADGAFVPVEQTIRLQDKVSGTVPGGELNGGIFRLPMSCYNGVTFLAPILGAARGALQHYLDNIGRSKPYIPSPSYAELGHAQVALGRITARLDTAELLIRRAIADTEDAAGDRPAALLQARSARDWAHTAVTITEAIDELYHLAGTRAQSQDNPIQRAWRDVHSGASHFALSYPRNVGRYGEVLLSSRVRSDA
jgi:3-hydroxy-9,10-secoandrosta-1,3,5(10)-triene-9,17-dione monooxygenase